MSDAGLSSAELKRAKRAVRREVLAERDAMTEEARERGSELIAERFLALPEAASARTVMAFWPFGSEPDTAPLIEALTARGVRVALPKVEGAEIRPLAYEPGDEMAEETFGAFYPAAGEPLQPEEIDVIVTPAVAFDREGRRVGYGGGFYDRFFPRARKDAARAGICFGLQLLDGPLPAGHFDLRVGVVVTDVETVRCPPPA